MIEMIVLTLSVKMSLDAAPGSVVFSHSLANAGLNRMCRALAAFLVLGTE